jgi:hypothetical protein
MLDSPKFWEAFGGDDVDLNVDYSVEDGEEELIIKGNVEDDKACDAVMEIGSPEFPLSDPN